MPWAKQGFIPRAGTGQLAPNFTPATQISFRAGFGFIVIGALDHQAKKLRLTFKFSDLTFLTSLTTTRLLGVR